MKTIGRILLPVGLALLGCNAEGVVGGQQTLTWDEFRNQAYQEPDTGVYIVNGDEMAESVDLLQDDYAAFLKSVDQSVGVGTADRNLIVNLVNGRDDKWSSSAAVNLTYCVSQSSFGSHYSAVVTAMDQAAAAWENTARVNFIHDASQDGNCTARSNVVFDVRQVCRNQYLARSFFPSSSRRSREVLIDCTSFGNITPWSLAGVLRHELGHTIGFRHEHTRPEAGTCFEDNNWRELTVYDSASVMHYPQCNGTNQGDLILTSLDRQGASSLYP